MPAKAIEGDIAGMYLVWKGMLLVHKRAAVGFPASHNKISTPGGKVDSGEDFFITAIRELEEEANVSLPDTNKGNFHVLNRIENRPEFPNSVMYYRVLRSKPIVGGATGEFKREVDMDFDFEGAGVKGETAGPGYFWAEVKSLKKFLDEHPRKYKQVYMYANLVKLIHVLDKRSRATRKV